MIRFVVIALIVLAAWVLLRKLFQEAKNANIDWTGIATIVGFITLAFYLRHVTGMGCVGQPFVQPARSPAQPISSTALAAG